MSTASRTDTTSFGERLAQWRKERRLERQGRTVASRQMRGGALFARYVLLIVVAIVLVGPLILPLMAAFKAPGESVFGQGATILPQQWSLDSFEVLFERTNILSAIKNSAIIAALTVTSNIILSCIGGYMLSRRGWTGRTVMYFVVLSAMIFPFESIMLSLFKMMVQLDLYNTLPGVWMVAMIGPFQILMMRAAFMGIPDEIEDAALIDGAGELRRFWSIFLPQVRGTLTVVGLTSFIGAWSDFIFPLLMLPNPEKQTLMLTLTAIQNSPQGVTYQLVLAGAVVAMIPVVLVFMFSQKFFFRGIEDGGLVGWCGSPPPPGGAPPPGGGGIFYPKRRFCHKKLTRDRYCGIPFDKRRFPAIHPILTKELHSWGLDPSSVCSEHRFSRPPCLASPPQRPSQPLTPPTTRPFCGRPPKRQLAKVPRMAPSQRSSTTTPLAPTRPRPSGPPSGREASTPTPTPSPSRTPRLAPRSVASA